MRWPWARRKQSRTITFQVSRRGFPLFATPVTFSAHVGSKGHLEIVCEGAEPDVVVDFEVKDGWP